MYAPKSAGTANLITAAGTTLQPVAAVQLFSSVAAALGSGGQSNYASANALLDLTSSTMQQSGLPGMSVKWGAWAGAGMAAHAGKALPHVCVLRSTVAAPAYLWQMVCSV